MRFRLAMAGFTSRNGMVSAVSHFAAIKKSCCNRKPASLCIVIFRNSWKRLPSFRSHAFVLDGEIVIYVGKQISFDNLLMRIHPAASRIRKLSSETPATYLCFDLLVDAEGQALNERPLSARRQRLEQFFGRIPRRWQGATLPASSNRRQAQQWMQERGKLGLDGIVAKRLDEPYHSGERIGMVKIKRIRTADTVVGGFRYAEKGGGVGSLLLGLYDREGLLDHIGFTSSFNSEQRQELKKIVAPLIGGPGFTGHAPGGPSRWSTKRSTEWQPLKPKLVAEVRYDHFSGGRFRHGTKFLRWRPEKKPQDCTFDQLELLSAKLNKVL